MYRKIITIIVAIALALSCSGTSVYGAEKSTSATYYTIVMQGNTESASDCQTFKDSLLASGNGYTVFSLRGWENNSNEVDDHVYDSEFKEMKNYDVAYYSGHGGVADDYEDHPLINYSESASIDVAEVLQVSSDAWKTESYITPNDKLRVIILASCEQLRPDAAKYYARIMKASKVRAIAGYHAGSPSTGDDDRIAWNFIDIASEGNSVWYSWEHANSGKSWAVLVYRSNSNQYYRLPGFPGKTYSAPSSSASIYRYANNLESPVVTPVTQASNIENTITELPLTITAIANRQDRGHNKTLEREVVFGEESIPNDDSVVRNYFNENKEGLNFDDKICVQYYVTSEEVNEYVGVLPETRQVIERTFLYYDTYLGIKVVDSYIGASVDCEGLKNVNDERKRIIEQGPSISSNISSGKKIAYCSKESAIDSFLATQGSYEEDDIVEVSLAYVPAKDSTYQLCYEVRTEYDFHYVNVQTGEIVIYS